jgi:hypothetical protein
MVFYGLNNKDLLNILNQSHKKDIQPKDLQALIIINPGC